MESNYELFRNLKNLSAIELIKRTNKCLLRPEELVMTYLKDGDEVLFHVESYD